MPPKLKVVILSFLVLMLTLPIMAPKQNLPESAQKEDVFYKDSLPVYSEENIFSKYIGRFKSFYNLDKLFSIKLGPQKQESKETATPKNTRNISQAATPDNANVNTNTDDGNLFFAEDNNQPADITASQNSGHTPNSDTVNLAKGTVFTANNLILYPTQEGYTYNGNFYKNGTYPKGIDKNTIENALSRYHNRATAKAGKKAIYIKNKNGKLTVMYVDELPSQNLNITNKYENTSSQGNTFLASNKFRNIHNKYKGIQASNKQNSTGKMNYATASSAQDMSSAYDALQAQIDNINLKINLSETINNSINNSDQGNTAKSKDNPQNADPAPQENPKDTMCKISNTYWTLIKTNIIVFRRVLYASIKAFLWSKPIWMCSKIKKGV